MIAKAIFSIIKVVTDFVFNLFPSINVFPAGLVSVLTSFKGILVSSASLVKWLLGATFYNIVIDYIVVIFGIKLFKSGFDFFKKYLLLR